MVEQKIEQLSTTSLVLRLAAAEKGLELADTQSRNAETYDEMFQAEEEARHFQFLATALAKELDKRFEQQDIEKIARKLHTNHLTKR